MDLSQHKKNKAQTRQLKNYKDKLEKYDVFKSIWKITFESQIAMVKNMVENLENLLSLSNELLDKWDDIGPDATAQDIDSAEIGLMTQNSDFNPAELSKSNVHNTNNATDYEYF